MDGLQNILGEIAATADKSAADIAKEAEKNALRIIEQSEKEAEKEAEAIISEASKKADAIKRAAKSEVSVSAKKKGLLAERALVDKVMERAKVLISELDDKSYFDYIARFSEKNSDKQKKGLLKLCARDLGRVPEGFSAKIAEYGLTISKEPVNISGGAVISYGDIEINGSFEAITDIEAERLCDVACDVLFDKRGGKSLD